MIVEETKNLEPFYFRQIIPEISYKLNENIKGEIKPIDLTDSNVNIYLMDSDDKLIRLFSTYKGDFLVDGNTLTVKPFELTLYPGYYRSEASIILSNKRMIFGVFQTRWAIKAHPNREYVCELLNANSTTETNLEPIQTNN